MKENVTKTYSYSDVLFYVGTAVLVTVAVCAVVAYIVYEPVVITAGAANEIRTLSEELTASTIEQATQDSFIQGFSIGYKIVELGVTSSDIEEQVLDPGMAELIMMGIAHAASIETFAELVAIV
jgi:hypothetical protein